MIRKTIIVLATAAAISITVLWFNLIQAGSFSTSPDMHYMGFAMIRDSFNQSLRTLCYRSYPSVAIPIQWRATPQYNLLLIPLWSLLVLFWCYPIGVFLRRAKRRRYVERRWFAVAAGMSAFAVAAFAVIYLFLDSIVYRKLERLTGSDVTALAVALVLLVVVSAISAIVTHNVVAGPLRRASLRKPRMCVNCSYNLTGNESGTCPECGTKVKQP